MKISAGVIIVASKKYEDILKIFLELFEKMWPDCQYDKYILCDSNIQLADKFTFKMVVDDQGTIPGRIKRLADRKKHSYYFCFLGDAFFGRKVNQYEIESFLAKIKEHGINYCNLRPRKKEKSHYFRMLNCNDYYGVSFISYLASLDFIHKEYSDEISDIDFEKRYLNYSCLLNEEKLKDKAILTNDIFNINHGIIKGKWERKAYREVCKNSILARKSSRKKMSLTEEFKNKIADLSYCIFTPKERTKIKKVIKKIGLKFITEN